MKRNILIILLTLGFLFAIAYFIRTNSTSSIEYDTTTPFTSSIQKTSVVTGKVIPEDEVEIKPQLNGIIQQILVEEGDEVKNGDLIAMIKVVAPKMCLNVVDRSIQAHGGAGLNHDLPLAGFFGWARALRFADGPDEVHLRAIARSEVSKYKKSK